MDIWGRMVFILCFVGGASGLRWSEELRADSGTIQVCSGQSIQLFWNYTLEKGERVKSMVWGCQPEGEEEDVLATFVDDHFVPASSFSGRLAHLHDGGIELSCATILDSGSCSIAVSTEDSDNSLTVYHNTVSVKVVDTPKTQRGEIQVTREAEVMHDVISGEWHVQLSCGNFSDLGQPPVQVIWTTPQGERVESSSYDGNGFFRLLLPNPVQGGNYTCSIAPFQPAAQCLPRDSHLLDTHRMVEVQETDWRFSLLEARQQELMDKMAEGQETDWRFSLLEARQQELMDKMAKGQETTGRFSLLEARQQELMDKMAEVQETTGRFSLLEARQQEMMDKMPDEQETAERLMDKTAAERCYCTSLVETMANRTSLLEQRLDEALQRSVPISFHARLSTDILLSNRAILKLTNVISNQGGGYDPNTGYFTAPLNGSYFFIGTTGSYSSSNYANIRLVKSGTVISQTYVKRYSVYHGMGSCHGAVYLTAGDKVWLQSAGSSSFSGISNFFSGFRIY